ncbi:minichromosome maintenance complex component 4 (nucleomorph) [Lotharella oceanica]|uniref:Minichromosome maintenance complex component 4 n=2 Tax=Lotharella oceanica TaxID=641309 RepID=A0A060DAT0_9EUKA|nr:minichromosome maintenance complex component 4 [Lotharella oceanica]
MDNHVLEKLIYNYICTSNIINYQIYKKIYKKILNFYYFNSKFNKFQFIKNLIGFTDKIIKININLTTLKFYNDFIYHYIIKNPIKTLLIFEICILKYFLIKYSILLSQIKIIFTHPLSIVKQHLLKPFLINKLICTCSRVSRLLHYTYFNKKYIKSSDIINSKNIYKIFKNFFISRPSSPLDKEIYKNPVLMFFNSVSFNQILLYQYTFEIMDANLNKAKLSHSYTTEARILEDLKYFNFIGNVFFFTGILAIKPMFSHTNSKTYPQKLHTYFIQVLNFKKKITHFLQIICLYDKLLFTHLFSNKLFYYILVNNLVPNINGNYHIKKGFLVQAISITSTRTLFYNIYSKQIKYIQAKAINILIFGHKIFLKHQIYRFLKLLVENSFIIDFTSMYNIKKKNELKTLINTIDAFNIQLICIQGINHIKLNMINLIHEYISNMHYQIETNNILNFYHCISYANWYNLSFDYIFNNLVNLYNSYKKLKNIFNYYDLIFVNDINKQNLKISLSQKDVKEKIMNQKQKNPINLLNFYSLKYTISIVKKLKIPHIKKKTLYGVIKYFITIRAFSNFNNKFSPFFFESIIKISTVLAKLGFSQLIHYRHIKEALCIINSKKHLILNY